MTPAGAPTVFVIDDDAAVRASIQGLLKSVGLPSESFGTAQEFLRSKRPDGPSCLVLDVRLPGINGLDFQRELADAGVQIPIIFITGHGDIPMTVKAMKSGAIEFLRSEEHTSELQSQSNLVCRLLLEKKKTVIVELSTDRWLPASMYTVVMSPCITSHLTFRTKSRCRILV